MRKKIQRWLILLVVVVVVFGVYVLPRIDANNRVTKAMEYYDIANEMSAKYGVPTSFIVAVIAAESSGKATVVSRAGAVGLMQIMPATGRGLARQLGMTDFTVQSLSDPRTNIELGTYYLAQLLARYGGSEELALAAYNGGPGSADRYVRSGTLPRETRRYIPTVNTLKSQVEQAIAERDQPTSLLPEGQQKTGVTAGLLNWLAE